MLNRILAILLCLITFSLLTKCYGQTQRGINTYKKNYAIPQIKRPKADEIEHAKEVDLVIIGEVVKVNNLPGPSSEVFHSEAIIKIDSILKGKANFKKVVLLRMSGPITDKKFTAKISVDANFKIGQRCIFFLIRPVKSNFLTSPFIQKGIYSFDHPYNKDVDATFKPTFNGQKSLSDLPDSVFWGDNKCKDLVISDSVHYRWGTFDLKTVIKEIKTLKQSPGH